MLERLKFSLIAGTAGAVVGGGVAFLVQGREEKFPVYVLVAFTTIFAVAGVCMKRKWIDGVLEFFDHVLPWS